VETPTQVLLLGDVRDRNGFNTYSAVKNIAKSQSLNNIAKKDGLPLKIKELKIGREYEGIEGRTISKKLKLIRKQYYSRLSALGKAIW
jgi:hypothetical protein